MEIIFERRESAPQLKQWLQERHALFKERGMTVTEFCSQVGVSPQYWHSLRSPEGVQTISHETLSRIEQLLGVYYSDPNCRNRRPL